MKAVADKKMTINAAATKFSLPRKTLDYHIKGRVQHGTTPGHCSIWQVVISPSPVPWSRYLPGP